MSPNEEIKKKLGEEIAAAVSEQGILRIDYREGKAQELPSIIPNKLSLAGTIMAPAEFVSQRVELLNQKDCSILVDRDKFTIDLAIHETSPYPGKVHGQLTISPEYERWNINGDSRTDCFTMADFIKMNRIFFEDTMQAMKLVTQLRNFQATIERHIEQNDDHRGNARLLKQQAVEHNLPESFHITIPIFKGEAPQTIEVEIDVSASDLSMKLISPEAMDIIHTTASGLIDASLNRIKADAPGIVIIEK